MSDRGSFGERAPAKNAGDAREPLAPGLIERGTVPCLLCGKPHDLTRTEEQAKRHVWGSWVQDGHPYHRMTAEQIVERYELTPRAKRANQKDRDVR